MELWLTLRFRGSPLGLRISFPPELAFIARQLRSLDGPEVAPSDRISTAYVRVTPEQAETLLAWGGVRTVDGRTLLASATFEERWRAHELAPGGVVELARAASVDSPVVLARGRSHVARWACSYCDRLRWEQVGALELSLDEAADVELVHRARPELLLTSGGELVVSSRLRPIFEGQGSGHGPCSGPAPGSGGDRGLGAPRSAAAARGPRNGVPGLRRRPARARRWTGDLRRVCVLRPRPWTLGAARTARLPRLVQQRLGSAGRYTTGRCT
jgi:hypothetical protein